MLNQLRKPKNNIKIYKRIAIISIATLSAFTITVVITKAVGYDITDLIRKAIKSPDRTSSYENQEFIVAENTRFYNSMSEMLEAENLNILYPEELPEGYSFTDFKVSDYGTYIEVRAYATEPYLSFMIEIGANQIDPNNYLHEANGIKYGIDEIDNGLYQACWFNGTDYYTIVVSDKALLPEIIENLKKS